MSGFLLAFRAVPRLGALVLVLGLMTACAEPLDLAAFAGAEPTMRPEVFFAGTTRGRGVVQSLGGRPTRRFTVVSHGDIAPDGTLRLAQTVTFADGETRERAWRMTPDEAGGYRATLSEAEGPVTLAVAGNVLRLRYTVRRPFVTLEQWLYLHADGQSALNEGTVRVLGLPVLRLSEVIRRVPD